MIGFSWEIRPSLLFTANLLSFENEQGLKQCRCLKPTFENGEHETESVIFRYSTLL